MKQALDRLDLVSKDPFLRIKTRSCRKEFSTPPPALFWTARFAFSRGDAVREVPYDPHLEYVPLAVQHLHMCRSLEVLWRGDRHVRQALDIGVGLLPPHL